MLVESIVSKEGLILQFSSIAPFELLYDTLEIKTPSCALILARPLNSNVIESYVFIYFDLL